MITSATTIVVSIALLVVTARMPAFYLNMAVAAAAGGALALTALVDIRRPATGDAAFASTSYRHMGLIWLWGALAIAILYNTVLTWREWWEFVIAFGALAALSFFLSETLKKDAENGNTDTTMLNVARILAIVLLVAMLATMVGLLVDGKMWRFTKPAGLRSGWQDWGANNVFFFGAMAIAAIAGSTWYRLRRTTP